MNTVRSFAPLVAALLLAASTSAETPASNEPAFEQLSQLLQRQWQSGAIVGGQVAVARNQQLLYSQNVGVVSVGSEKKVGDDTLFLIGSCSKPFASLCVLSLIDDPHVAIGLNDRIDRWLPAFAKAKVQGGKQARRAPTVAELMSHRAGIYSQKVGMTDQQAHWIRSFRHTLAEGVDEMAKFNLIAQPGVRYAYSGAGYCVLGRVAERAAEQDFEALLQQRVCKPLGLERTTYFPAGQFVDEEIATGIGGDAAPHRLGSEHRFPLIGGSLYSTASEMTRFGGETVAQLAGGAGRLDLDRKLRREWIRIRTPESGYGLGWLILPRQDLAPQLIHGGALQAYRAWIGVDLETGITVAGCWTLGKPEQKRTIQPMLKRTLDAFVAP